MQYRDTYTSHLLILLFVSPFTHEHNTIHHHHNHHHRTTEIVSDPAYPGQWRVNGAYIEQVAKMTHWEYPEAVERFGRQLAALGIAAELQLLGATDGDLVMVDEYDFEFAPGMTNPYIPGDLLERDVLFEEEEERRKISKGSRDGAGGKKETKPEPEEEWRPFRSGGYMDDDPDELVGFNDDDAWNLLEEPEDDNDVDYSEFFPEEGDEVWQSWGTRLSMGNY